MTIESLTREAGGGSPEGTAVAPVPIDGQPTLAELNRYVDIVEDPDRLPADPVVSVCTTTYNHEAFIADAIEGFLMQETTFPFEILIGEDKSTDDTRAIVLDYQERYPEKIRLRLSRQNLYSISRRWNSLGLRLSARGRYIAMCEGDDYWTDPHKLQKQIDFLESNPDYVISFHDARAVNAEGNVLRRSELGEERRRDLSAHEVMIGEHIITATMCFRNAIRDYPPEFFRAESGDVFIRTLLGQYGKAKFQPEIDPSVYRVHEGGVWNARDFSEQVEAYIKNRRLMHAYHEREGNDEVARALKAIYTERMASLVHGFITERDFRRAAQWYSRLVREHAKDGDVPSIARETARVLGRPWKFLVGRLAQGN